MSQNLLSEGSSCRHAHAYHINNGCEWPVQLIWHSKRSPQQRLTCRAYWFKWELSVWEWESHHHHHHHDIYQQNSGWHHRPGDYTSVWAHSVSKDGRKDKFCHRPRWDSSVIDVLLLLMRLLSHISPGWGKQKGRKGKETAIGGKEQSVISC